ncbi:transposase [Pseudomonas sp. HR96]|uniref:REP-associated tyrosine transposase n=1 Tax=Pseudomonas sp. HR96 TaxID=1027966 RepID=UPI002A748706|nr:transposase [Pseudomonas sp. HR96]WPO98695.1 transposase [Pseudomonas sp. HR96]
MSYRSYRLRIARHSEIGRCYLITTSTFERVPFFANWQIGRLVVAELRILQEAGQARSIAWLLMPDHLHWLVELQAGDISTAVGRAKSRSAAAINRARGTTGAVWQAGFHDRAIRKDEDMKAVARYVLRNPIEAGLVRRIGDYPLWDASWI